MQFLRLPSGSGVNVENINTYSRLISNEDNTKTVMLYRCNDGVNETIEGADARALYAWLTANSTPIGEDGREVGAKTKKNDIELSEAQWAVLEFLAKDMDTALPFHTLERKTRISSDELEKLEASSLISRNVYNYPHTFEITAGGYNLVVDGDE